MNEQMNTQPDFLFEEIFSYLPFKEKIKLKSVCKRWNEFIGQQTANQRRLLVYEKRMSHSFGQTFGSPRRPVRYEERVGLKVFMRFLEGGYFKNLKVLYLYRVQIGRPSAALLDCLHNLEELFLYARYDRLAKRVPIINELWQVSREFSNLRTFSVQKYDPRDFVKDPQKRGDFLINAPNLERFIFSWGLCGDRSHSIHLSNYESIRFVQCPSFDESLQFERFVNLEELVCQVVSKEFRLSNYPKLRKIGLFPYKHCRSLVESLVRQRNESIKHRNLEISVCGLKEVAEILLDTTSYGKDEIIFSPSTLGTLKSNFSKFQHSVPFPWRVKLHIKEPVCEFDQLSRYFSVVSVREVFASDLTISNSKCLIRFLRAINGVHSLKVWDCSFDQTFFDELPSIACIYKLDIFYWKNPVDLNYEFLRKIRFLSKIFLAPFRGRFPIDPVCKIIIDLKIDRFRIGNLFFELDSHHVLHRRERDPNLRLEVFRGTEGLENLFTRKFETLEQALAFLRECPEVKPGLQLDVA